MFRRKPLRERMADKLLRSITRDLGDPLGFLTGHKQLRVTHVEVSTTADVGAKRTVLVYLTEAE